LTLGFVNEEAALRETARAILADLQEIVNVERTAEANEKEMAALIRGSSNGGDDDADSIIDNDNGSQEEKSQYSFQSRYTLSKDEGVGKLVEAVKGRLCLSGAPPPPLKKISNEFCTDLKSIFGYQMARNFIVESGLPYDKEMQKFVDLPLDNGTEDIRWYDTKVERDFLYNAAHGTRLWVTKFYHPHLGEVLKELTYQYGPRLHPISTNNNKKHPAEDEEDEEEDHDVAQ